MNNNNEYELADFLLKKLFPINRSITGKGLRKFLDIVNELELTG